MRTYEILFIVDPKASEEDVAKLQETLAKVLTDQGATLTKNELLGRRQLAYQIGRLTEGTYILFEVEGTGKEIAELERRMRVSDLVVRFLSVRVDEDRQRAEKFRARRAAKAERRTTRTAPSTSSNMMDDDDDDMDGLDEPSPIAATRNTNNNRRRRRKVSRLLQDKIDIIDFKDVELLRSYIPERGKIAPRRLTNTTARHQRMLCEAIKRARHIALLPYVLD